MEPFSIVRTRQRRVRWGIVAFAAGLLLHIVATNLIFLVWLAGEEFATRENAICLAWMSGLVAAVCVVQFLRLNRRGDRIAKLLGAVSLDSAVAKDASLAAKAKQVTNILEELCIAGSCARPSIFLLPQQRRINAFAAGFADSGWCIAISRGAIDDLPRDEMQALMAHELAHLRLLDTRNVQFLAATIAGLGLIAILGLIIAVTFARAREGLALSLAGWALVLFGLIGALIAIVLEAAVSRQQEFCADAEGVRLCRSSSGMVGLLERLAQQSLPTSGHGFDISQGGVTGMLLRSMNFEHAARKALFESHPPLVERIRVFDPAAADRVAKRFAANG